MNALCRMAVILLIVALSLALPSQGISQAPKLTEGSMADVYRDKYGWPEPDTEGLPEWLVEFLWEQLPDQPYWVRYGDHGGFKAPKTKNDAIFTILSGIPNIKDDLAQDPEMLAQMRRAVNYLHKDILLILALEVDTVSRREPPSGEKYRELLLTYLDSLVQLAGLTSRPSENGDGNQNAEEK